jgi:hypothetical protein
VARNVLRRSVAFRSAAWHCGDPQLVPVSHETLILNRNSKSENHFFVVT